MVEETTFLGEPIAYWIALKEKVEMRPDGLEVSHLIEELIEANAKVRYYERQIDRMNAYRKGAA